MRTRLFWILPFGRVATAGAWTGFAGAAAVGVETGVSPGGGGTVLCCAWIAPPFKQSKVDSKNTKRLIGSREDETDDSEIKSLQPDVLSASALAPRIKPRQRNFDL